MCSINTSSCIEFGFLQVFGFILTLGAMWQHWTHARKLKLRDGTATFSLFIGVVLVSAFFSLDVYARAGGGGGGSGKCGVVCMILAPIGILYSLYVAIRIRRKNQQIKFALREMSEREPEWTEDNLLSMARDKFMRMQTAWGDQNLGLLKKELHPSLFPNWESQIQQQISRGERNIMAGLSVNDIKLVSVKNYTDDEKDEFTVCIKAGAEDQTFSGREKIKSERTKFTEFWTFEREQTEWVLREVTQSDGWRRFVSSAIIDQSNDKKRKS